jgi:hypothetical protein
LRIESNIFNGIWLGEELTTKIYIMKTEEYYNEGTPFKSMKPALSKGAVMPSYSLEEVRLLLQKQKEQTIFSLGLSSAVYVYPMDYERMKEWMLNCPLVL